MGRRQTKSVLFLCTGNYYRSRFAELLFNGLAERMGLAWRATSRGLECRIPHEEPMAKSAIEALQAMGIRSPTETKRLPIKVTEEDFKRADWIVALRHDEHLPMLQADFSAWTDKVEFWEVEDAPDVLPLIEAEVQDLTARLIAGGRKREKAPEVSVSTPTCPKCEQPQTACSCAKKTAPKKSPVVRVGRETKGRRGKGVTTVFDLDLSESELLELAATLKAKCGTGGTVKDGRIEIQGDQRNRLVSLLEGMGYRVKRSGG